MTTGVTIAAPALDAKVALQNGDGNSSIVSRATKAMAIWRNDREKDSFSPDEDAQSRVFRSGGRPDPQAEDVHVLRRQGMLAQRRVQADAGSDFAGAAREAETSVTSCQSAGNQEVLAHAFFNSGMALYLSRDYDTAIMRFNQAAHLEPNEIISDAMAECRQAKLNDPSSPKTAMAKPTADERKQSTVSAGAVEERLHRVDDLHKKGLITDDEYAQKRKKILNGL